MGHKEMIAMLLAGGEGKRLGVLTKDLAKPAVHFGGKYRIIDFTLSNCMHSGIDTVGVLTQYQPLELNRYLGIGSPWGLDRSDGGMAVLPRTSNQKAAIGTKEPPMPSIRIWDSSTAMSRNTCSSSPAIISTRWTTRRCWSITRSSERM